MQMNSVKRGLNLDAYMTVINGFSPAITVLIDQQWERFKMAMKTLEKLNAHRFNDPVLHAIVARQAKKNGQ